MEKYIGTISAIIGVIIAFVSFYKTSYIMFSTREDEYYKMVLEPFYLSVIKDKEKIINVKMWLKENCNLLPSKIAVVINDDSVTDLEILKMLIVDYIRKSYTLQNIMFQNMINISIVIINIIILVITGLLGYDVVMLVTQIANNTSENLNLYSNKIIGLLISTILPVIIVFLFVIPMLIIFYKCCKLAVSNIDSYANITLKEANLRRESDLDTYNKLKRKKTMLVMIFEEVYI